MDVKKILLPLMLLLFVASVSAMPVITLYEPDGNTYYPNQGDDFVDVKFRIINTGDINANPVYNATIQFYTVTQTFLLQMT